jgi:hypothetical protein
MGGKRKRNRHKRGVASDIRRLKEQPAAPGIIRLTDGGFAERLVGKYAWRTAGQFARGAMVHRMQEQARTQETIAVQLKLMLRQTRLMVPLHLRIDYRSPALPRADRRDAAAPRTGSAGRDPSSADAARGRRTPSGDGSRSGGQRRETDPGSARPAERLIERRSDRILERQVERLVERRESRLVGRGIGAPDGSAGGRRTEPAGYGRSASRAGGPDVSATSARRGPGRIGLGEISGELPAARAFRLLSAAVRTPLFGARGDAEGEGRRVRPVLSAPALLHPRSERPDAPAIAALRGVASALRNLEARSVDDRRRPRLPEEPADRPAIRTAFDASVPSAMRRSVPASPAVSATPEPPAPLVRAALRASALPAAPVMPEPPAADARTVMAHRTPGDREDRADILRGLERLVRQIRRERAAERMTLSRAMPDRLMRGGSTGVETPFILPADGTTAPSTVSRRTIQARPATLAHAPAAWRAAMTAVNAAAASAAGAAVRLAAVAAARAAARGQATEAAGRTADLAAARTGETASARFAGMRAPIIVARSAAGTRTASRATASIARTPQAEPLARISSALADRMLAAASRVGRDPGALRHARLARGGRNAGDTTARAAGAADGATARQAADSAASIARAAVPAATRLVTLQPPSLAAADLRTTGGIVHATPESRPAARSAVPVRVAWRTAPEDRIAARPHEPRRRTVPALVLRQRETAAFGGARAAFARSAAASSPPSARSVGTAAEGGRDAIPGLPVSRGITPVARQPVRRGLTSVPLTVRRGLTASAAAPLAAAGPVQTAPATPGAASSPQQAGAPPQPAELRFASASRQLTAQAEAIARSFAGANRAHERRDVRDVPLQVAARPSGRPGEAATVINELKSALRNVEKELGRMKEAKPAPAINFNHLAEELYKAVNRRFRLDQHRRGL